MQRLARLFMFCVSIVLLAGISFGQTMTGSVAGVVKDPSGAMMANVKVVLTSKVTSDTREITTSGDGSFRFYSILPGEYSLKVEASGFRTYVREPIRVTVASESYVEVNMEVGAVTSVVTVEAGAALVEPTKSHIQTTLPTRTFTDLPGRPSLTIPALLVPGTVQNTTGPGSTIVAGGARSRSNNFQIDGTNNNDDSLSIPRQTLAPENIAEYQVINNLFPAEFGRNSGSVINVVTKAGGNNVHGAVWWFWEGNGLNALTSSQERTYNANIAAGATKSRALRLARAPNVTNEAGVNIGGPAVRDRIFYFASYDLNRSYTGASPSRAAIRASDLLLLETNAANCGYSTAALAWIRNTFPVANDPTVTAVVNARNTALPTCPASTNGLQFTTFNRVLVSPNLTASFRQDRAMGRVDFRINNSNNLLVRYLFSDSLDKPVTSLPGQEVGTKNRGQSLTIQETWVLKPTLVNEFRFSYNRRGIDFPLGGTVRDGAYGVTGVGGAFGLGNSNMPQFRTDNIYQWQDNMSWSRGGHSMKFGADVRRLQLNSFFAPTIDGSVAYDSLLDLLLDRNATFQRGAGDGVVNSRTTEFAGFFQDDWKIRSNVTLNLGLRYEYTGTPFGFFSGAKPDINNWLPRFGFAYTPGWGGGITGHGKTVLRGGYGIFVDQVFQNILLNNSRNWPRFVNIVQSPITGQQMFLNTNWPQVTPANYTGNPDLLPLRWFSPNKRVAQPYQQQWSLQIQREFWTDYVFQISYVGSKGTKLVREVERNLGFLGGVLRCSPLGASLLAQGFPVAPIPAPFDSTTICTSSASAASSYRNSGVRPDATKGSILVGDGMANSNYNAMWVKLDKRFSKGLTFGLAYTWSTYISDSDDILGGQVNQTLPSNPLNLRMDRGRSIYDRPHRVVVNWSYTLPTAWKSNAIANKFTGGWQVAGIFTVQSGQPYSVFVSTNPMGILPGQISTIHQSQRAMLNPGGDTCAVKAGLFCLPSINTMSNPLFTATATNSGLLGTSGRNILRAIRINNWDLTIAKNTTFRERHTFQLRLELFNALSHRQFTTSPTNTISTTSTTSATGSLLNVSFPSASGRELYLGVRYLF